MKRKANCEYHGEYSEDEDECPECAKAFKEGMDRYCPIHLRNRTLFFLGKPGIGMSMIARSLAENLCKEVQEENDPS